MRTLRKGVLLAALGLAAPAAAAEPEQRPQPQHFDPSSVDKAVDPCTDFYAYACNTWLKSNPIPPDRGSFGRGSQLFLVNQYVLRDVLEGASADKADRKPSDKQIGDFYAACMDEKGIEAKGMAALEGELKRLNALKSKGELAGEVARLHALTFNLTPPNNSGGAGPLFFFSSTQDLDDAKKVVTGIDQAGLGLPDRDYYLKDDPKSVETRTHYQAHVQKMLELLGAKPAQAAAEAKTILNMEEALAKGAMDIVKRRDPANLNHKLSQAELAALTPSFDWKAYLKEAAPPATEHYLVATPDFLKALEVQLKARSLEDWKTYLRWHLVHASASLLPKKFVDENFAFYGRELAGAKELAPRWKRCAMATDRDLGEALGQAFADRAFGPDAKKRMTGLVQDLERALDKDITKLDWMSAVTQKQAQDKLKGILDKIGYPEKPRDYGSVKVGRADPLANAYEAGRFEYKRQLDKIGKPVDRTEWGMTAPTVNAYYDPQMNTINFPAGILQPPFFDNAMDDAVNYGDIGSVIGHELTHGFDDEGRKFDATGNLRDWWTPEDGKKFEERAKCVADEYSGFVAVGDLHVNGPLVLGEATADMGGTRIALAAFHDRLAQQKKQPSAEDDKRFFLAYASGWCRNTSDAAMQLMVKTDPHPPPRDRVNGVLSNMPEFQKAYACKAGAPMVRSKMCRVW